MAVTPLQWSAQPIVYSVGHLLDMLPAAMLVEPMHARGPAPKGR
jgi:hypothetical protein